jgi:hypothetical protein
VFEAIENTTGLGTTATVVVLVLLVAVIATAAQIARRSK